MFDQNGAIRALGRFSHDLGFSTKEVGNLGGHTSAGAGRKLGIDAKRPFIGNRRCPIRPERLGKCETERNTPVRGRAIGAKGDLGRRITRQVGKVRHQPIGSLGGREIDRQGVVRETPSIVKTDRALHSICALKVQLR